MRVEFEWDERKRISNLAKHGVDFRDAVRLNLNAAVIFEDQRRDYGEIRFVAYALLDREVHTMVFTDRFGRMRVISLRRANSKEIKRYEAEADIPHARGGGGDQPRDRE